MEVDLGQLRMPCTCGRAHNITVKGVWIEEGAARRLYEMLTEGDLREFTAPVIVWDENTSEAVEERMEDVAEICQEICLSGKDLRADDRSVEILEETLPDETDLILAVGGGTIHDLSRYVAYERRIPFISVPTAATMDGFTSTDSVLFWKGEKKRFQAEGPLYVFADTSIFSEAPYRLTASGISQVLGRYICLADWRISHLVTREYLCEEICGMEYRAVKDVVKRLDDIREKDEDACERLMYALLLTGLATQMTGSLRPAACAEHQMAWLWDLEVINGSTDAMYGEKIGAAALILEEYYSRFREAIEDGQCRVIPYEKIDPSYFREKFGLKGLYETILRENTPDPLLEVEEQKLCRVLPEIAEILEDIPSGEKLKDMMEEGGCRQTIGQVSLSGQMVREALELAPYIQRSLSFLRLSKMLKISEE